MMFNLIVCLLGLVSYQAPQDIKIKVIDQQNNPIEGVYIKCNNQFWYSNVDGYFLFNPKDVTKNDSIYFSHLSYQTLGLSYKEIEALSASPVVRLEEVSRELMEVSVSAFNAKKYVAEAIKKIPENYEDPFNSSLNLNAEIVFDRTGSDIFDAHEKLINYKGMLQLSKEDREYYVSKIPEYEYVSENVSENVFFVPVYNFIALISISNYDLNREYKKIDYTAYEFIDYKGVDAVKIYFKGKHQTGQTGFFIIDRETKAFLSIRNDEEKQYRRMTGLIKGKGLVTMSIDRAFEEFNFVKTSSGKYIFDSGRQNVDFKNKWKSHFVSSFYNVYLKRETTPTMGTSMKRTRIEDIF